MNKYPTKNSRERGFFLSLACGMVFAIIINLLAYMYGRAILHAFGLE